jgi:HD-GYP domain-containing protein (c-di-GMP phosphodiesterase class II)
MTKMLSKMISFFKPPEFENFELAQKAKFLHVTLLIIAVGSIFLGIQNIAGGTYLDDFLFILSGISLLGIPLNKHGYFRPTVFFVAALMLALITFSLIDGIGLKDAGLIAYPLFIIYVSFLFGKDKSPFVTLLAIGSVVLVYFLDRMGYLHPAKWSSESQLMIIVILLIATGFFLWAVMDNWERVMQNLKDTYDLTLSGWGKTLEYRDQETEGHSQRVTKLTVELAQRFGFSRQELDHIRRGALLHDIGKMAIPDAILLKNSSLTDDEWKIVKMHPVHARSLLENIPFLKPALDIPYCHHERWNGSGYPQGLLKDKIPLAARIFAVIDVWDALTSDRPYRQAWTGEKAKAYIQEQSAILFDPQIVQVFFEYINAKEQ